jgi:hypothetical protein
MDNMGGIILQPVSKKIRAQMRRHNKEWTGHASDTVYLNEGGEAGMFMEERMPPDKARAISQGYTETIQMDPWEFGHYVGYDFHEVIRP